MNTTQWIQIIASAAIVILTGGLVWVTWRYAKSTKKMAESMETQSKIMQREFELKVSPLVNILSQHSLTGVEKGEYHFLVENNGDMPVYLKQVETVFWHKKDPEINIPSLKENRDIEIASKSNKEIKIEINLADLNRILLDNQAKKEIMMQSIFYIENVEHKKFNFRSGERTVWS